MILMGNVEAQKKKTEAQVLVVFPFLVSANIPTNHDRILETTTCRTKTDKQTAADAQGTELSAIACACAIFPFPVFAKWGRECVLRNEIGFAPKALQFLAP